MRPEVKRMLRGGIVPLCIAVPWWAFIAGVIENILRGNLSYWTLLVFPLSYIAYFAWGEKYSDIFAALASMSLIALIGPTLLRLLYENDCVPAYCTGYVNKLFNIGCGEANSGCFIEGFILFFVASLMFGWVYVVVSKK
jgi:hypothetical protein